MKKIALIVFCFITISSGAFALPITGTNGIEGIGSFLGNFSFTASTNTQAQIVVSLTNTSPVDNGGYLTAFAFNNPGNLITGVSGFTTSLSTFDLIGDPTFNNTIKASPYPFFDLGGSSTNDSWLGGGSPPGGIAVGQTGIFTFSLTGSELLGLNDLSFFNTGDPWFAARFRGFIDGGSDKVPANPVPEPASILLFGTGLVVLGFARRFKKA
jgi:hypothetical protein